MKHEFSQLIFEKSSNIKFDEKSSSGKRSCSIRADRKSGRRTDITNLIFAFPNFSNARDNVIKLNVINLRGINVKSFSVGCCNTSPKSI